MSTPTPENGISHGKPAPSKRLTAVGVTAGLLGGGAIGLLMTVPSLTSAASDDAGTVAGAAVVALQDDTDTSTDVATDAVRPEPGERLRELLQTLVDDGTLTSAQADAVTEHLVENRPERDGHRRHRRGAAFDGEVVAGLIGIDVETLRDELHDGASIAEVATENGVDPQTIIDALVDELDGHLDLAVDDGRLTVDEAAERLEVGTERITARVNGERPGRS